MPILPGLQREKEIAANIFLSPVCLWAKNDNANNKREKIPGMA
jgi:hypothetical protein